MGRKCILVAVITSALAAASVQAEPLADFDALVARCKQAFDDRPMTEVVYAQAAGSWVKRMYAPAALSYRMQKTNSKISPFIAQIDITELASARRGEDEDTARALTLSMDENVMRSVRRINFSYQDDSWTVIGGSVVTEIRRNLDDAFAVVESVRLSREAVFEARGPVSNCVVGNRF